MNQSLAAARTLIRARVASEAGAVFTEAGIRAVLTRHRHEWGLDRSVSASEFLGFLLEEAGLRMVELRSEHYGRIRRYAFGQYSPYVVALSLRPRSYLSHGTAIFLNALNEQIPKTIYVNQEQSTKPALGRLSQKRLSMAFSHRQRMSNYVYALDSFRIVLLSGKQTGDLGVINLTGPQGEDLRVTGIPRTLVDIVVRPAYAGGILQVLEAYRNARDRIEAEDIVRTLKLLKYVYPYHQSIGFLMERAGYRPEDYEALRPFGTKYDFYLIHGMKKTMYDQKWKLFFPEGL